MNEYLVPANTKKSMLILGFLRPLPDLLILVSGVVLTVILLLWFDTENIWVAIVACIPALFCIALVMPIPNYHNVLVAIQSVLRFYQERRIYYWKGWCIYDEFKNDK